MIEISQAVAELLRERDTHDARAYEIDAGQRVVVTAAEVFAACRRHDLPCPPLGGKTYLLSRRGLWSNP